MIFQSSSTQLSPHVQSWFEKSDGSADTNLTNILIFGAMDTPKINFPEHLLKVLGHTVHGIIIQEYIVASS